MRHSVVTFTERPQFIVSMGGIAILLILTGTLLRSATFGGVPAMWFGLFLVCVFALSALRTMGATITLTQKSVTRRSPFGEWRMNWDEVERVEIGPACSTLILHGRNKRIWMTRPTASLESWFRSESDEDHEEPLVGLVLGMAEAQGAEFVDGWLTPFKLSRG